MMIWLLVNAMLGMLALLFLGLNRDTPHRLRFQVCMLALCGWLLPWQLLARLLPVTTLLPASAGSLALPAVLADIALPDLAALTQPSASLGITPALVLVAAFAVGFCLFLLTTLRHALLLRTLAASAQAHANTEIDVRQEYSELLGRAATHRMHMTAIRIQSVVPGALTTGVFKPVIWVHEDLVGDDALQAVLRHELVHIRQYDNASLCLITCIEKLLWWNPLVMLLAGEARRLLELSCDAACQREFAGYRATLNRLILMLSRTTAASGTAPQALCAGIFKDGNFNVERIRQLERKTMMKTANYFSAGMLGAAAVFIVACASVFSPSDTAAQAVDASEGRPVPEELSEKLAAIESREGPTQTAREQRERAIRAGLEVYADRLEQSYNALHASKSSLEARVQELEQQMERLE
ncbi:MAG: M56 family metallopeptidase [Pseudomonadales bacterium]|nr:M56 family metallopeptidase [Pseudomonadales bacterium]